MNKRIYVPVVFAIALMGAVAYGQGANQTSRNEQGGNKKMGMISLGAGGALMAATCPCALAVPPNAFCQAMCFGVGPGLISSGAMDMAMGGSRQGSIDGTANGTYGGVYTPGTGGDPGTSGTDSSSDGLSGDFGNAYKNAVDTAKSFGVDPTTPAGLAAANAKAGGMDDNGNYKGASLGSPEQMAMVDKIKADLETKYNVPNLTDFTGGGGGGGGRGHHGEGLDLAGLLKGSRDPASIDGLSKNFNGNAIGVAGDNIFKQITRRYQAKIKTSSFLK